ncbi:putative non-specific serine/threonine protein kinase [Helianthus annuus]|nr:putative non-specific serine/threonine protein kinase [Helianthus annuus]
MSLRLWFFNIAEERFNDIVGTWKCILCCTIKVLHRSYSLEADIWSVGVIIRVNTILGKHRNMNILCGFEGRPNFDDISWSSVSPETQKVKILLKRLLIGDYKKE